MKGERPEAVGGLVGGLLRKWGIAEKVERANVLARWDQIVGDRIAAVARPRGLDGATLFVEVRSAAWMMELGMMKPELMRRLNAGAGEGRIERIVFLQAGGGDESRERRFRGGRRR